MRLLSLVFLKTLKKRNKDINKLTKIVNALANDELFLIETGSHSDLF